MYRVEWSNAAAKDYEYLKKAGLVSKAAEVLMILENNPFEFSQKFKRLTGDLKGAYSRRIGKSNRVVYKVLPNVESLRDGIGEVYQGIVFIISMYAHYK